MAELEPSIVGIVPPAPPPPPVFSSLLLLLCMSSEFVKLLWQFGDLGSIFILTKFMPLLPLVDGTSDNVSDGATTHSSSLIRDLLNEIWLRSGLCPVLAGAQITGVVRLQPTTLAQ